MCLPEVANYFHSELYLFGNLPQRNIIDIIGRYNSCFSSTYSKSPIEFLHAD